jgi:uncharacterized protein (TIGR03437 family)
MRMLCLLAFIPAAALGQTFPAFQWIEKAGFGQDSFAGLATDAAGNTYIAGSTAAAPASSSARDIFVTKLDSTGNLLYSNHFGGAGDDSASALAADASGSVYITGITHSSDFPVTQGAFLTTLPAGSQGATFVMKLNADGSVAYSTFLSTAASIPLAIATDGAGSAFVAGTTMGGLPVTAGAYQPVCSCGVGSNGFFSTFYSDGFVARLNASGSDLIYATYLGLQTQIGMTVGTSIVAAPDGGASVAASSGVYRLSANGAGLLAHGLPKVTATVLASAPDGSLYVAGGAVNGPDGFQATSGAAQPSPGLLPPLPSQGLNQSQNAIVKMDSQLQNTLAATWFGGPYPMTIQSLSVDTSSHLFVGGRTAPHGLPTKTPLNSGFGNPETGFAAELSGDLTSVLFSNYFGDTEDFQVGTVAAGANGSLVLGGATINGSLGGTVWVNSLSLTPPPALRIDSVQNAASRLDDPVSAGETIVVQGAGFGSDAQLLFGGVTAKTISVTSNLITAVVPASLPNGAVTVQVQTAGAASNTVLVPVAVVSPGLFSVDGTGSGQGYILNQDGTMNSTSNPADPGDRITVFATGVGPVTFDHGYAVTATPVALWLYGDAYADGVAAVMGPMAGLPGDVYALTVYVPTHVVWAAQVGVVLKIGGGASQSGLAISIAQ